MFDNYCEYKFDETFFLEKDLLLRNFFARIEVLSLNAKLSLVSILQNYEFLAIQKKKCI
jgi:hypothetical protein